jgi:hypothetical protein
MITLTKLRELDLSAPPAPGRPMHLSAASGLVCVHSYVYVIADDELHLGVFPATGNEPGHLLRLFEGELPDGKKERKKSKPDLEGLTLLPPDGRYPHGALFAVGSGSRSNRRRGALLELDARGTVVGPSQAVDLTAIIRPLEGEFEALNIEGVVVSGAHLRLLQRGNKRHGANAIVSFTLAGLLDALRAGQVSAIKPSAIDAFDLGEVDGIPLSFTDGAVLPDGKTIFTAVAEDTDNPYDDGACAGAAIGMIDRNGMLRSVERLDKPYKVEGLHAQVRGDGIELLLVTDADDPSVPAGLYTAVLPEPVSASA